MVEVLDVLADVAVVDPAAVVAVAVVAVAVALAVVAPAVVDPPVVDPPVVDPPVVDAVVVDADVVDADVVDAWVTDPPVVAAVVPAVWVLPGPVVVFVASLGQSSLHGGADESVGSSPLQAVPAATSATITMGQKHTVRTRCFVEPTARMHAAKSSREAHSIFLQRRARLERLYRYLTSAIIGGWPRTAP